MKHLKIIFNALRGGLIMLATVCFSSLQAQENKLPPMDSVEISLLTCQPHDEVYSLYGHTAIRYHELIKGGLDVAFNYGVFNYNAPLFVLRFVFGLTDYELGAYPYPIFQQEYRRLGCMVTEQVLNLTAREKLRLREALVDNLKPANRIYRYNYFYNNCTTKARDIIAESIEGQLMFDEREDFQPTYREMVHQMTRNNPWSRFGNDVLLGIQADLKTDRSEQEFLPANLLYGFDHARIYHQGGYRPLVKERRIAVPAGVQLVQSGFPLSPTQVSLLLLGVGLLIFLIEWRKRRVFVAWEVALMILSGIIGCVLFLMLFSQHPTVRLNLQILFFNPIHLFYLYPVIKGRPTRYWHILAVLALLFFIGSIFQDYAEGIEALALCLLLQVIMHRYILKEK